MSELRYSKLASQALDAFVFNPGLDEMASAFGESLPTYRQGRLAALTELSKQWDFRRGQERQDTVSQSTIDQPDGKIWKQVFAAATQLGMVESSKPKNTSPENLLILGGANRAPLDRLRYGLASAQPETVYYMGATRPTTPVEQEKAKDYAPGALTEFELGCGAIMSYLEAKQTDESTDGDPEQAWREFSFRNKGRKLLAYAINTPKPTGQQRANTYDNFAHFAAWNGLVPGNSAPTLAVTTGFYVPGQHLPGVQELVGSYGVGFETIGHSAAYSGANRLASQLLQETKAAIGAADRLANILK